MKPLITLEEAKNYLKLDFDDEDDFLEEILTLAHEYMRDGITGFDKKLEDPTFLKKARLCMRAVVQELFDKRYLTVELYGGQFVEMNYLVRSLMFQMEYGKYGVQSRKIQAED